MKENFPPISGDRKAKRPRSAGFFHSAVEALPKVYPMGSPTVHALVLVDVRAFLTVREINSSLVTLPSTECQADFPKLIELFKMLRHELISIIGLISDTVRFLVLIPDGFDQHQKVVRQISADHKAEVGLHEVSALINRHVSELFGGDYYWSCPMENNEMAIDLFALRGHFPKVSMDNICVFGSEPNFLQKYRNIHRGVTFYSLSSYGAFYDGFQKLGGTLKDASKLGKPFTLYLDIDDSLLMRVASIKKGSIVFNPNVLQLISSLKELYSGRLMIRLITARTPCEDEFDSDIFMSAASVETLLEDTLDVEVEEVIFTDYLLTKGRKIGYIEERCQPGSGETVLLLEDNFMEISAATKKIAEFKERSWELLLLPVARDDETSPLSLLSMQRIIHRCIRAYQENLQNAANLLPDTMIFSPRHCRNQEYKHQRELENLEQTPGPVCVKK